MQHVSRSITHRLFVAICFLHFPVVASGRVAFLRMVHVSQELRHPSDGIAVVVDRFHGVVHNAIVLESDLLGGERLELECPVRFEGGLRHGQSDMLRDGRDARQGVGADDAGSDVTFAVFNVHAGMSPSNCRRTAVCGGTGTEQSQTVH